MLNLQTGGGGKRLFFVMARKGTNIFRTGKTFFALFLIISGFSSGLKALGSNLSGMAAL